MSVHLEKARAKKKLLVEGPTVPSVPPRGPKFGLFHGNSQDGRVKLIEQQPLLNHGPLPFSVTMRASPTYYK